MQQIHSNLNRISDELSMSAGFAPYFSGQNRGTLLT
jgi:hypothetical protein